MSLAVAALQALNPTPKVGASGVLYYNGYVLLGRRNQNDTQGGKWVTPGGGIEIYETVDQAIIREFKEETGLEVIVFDQHHAVVEQRIVTNEKHVIMIFKKVCYPDGKAFSPKPLDGFDKVGWFDYDKVKSMGIQGEITEMTYNALRAMW